MGWGVPTDAVQYAAYNLDSSGDNATPLIAELPSETSVPGMNLSVVTLRDVASVLLAAMQKHRQRLAVTAL
jgi:hypothetical protein